MKTEEALTLARRAVNSWACYAKRESEHRAIAELHREIDIALGAPPHADAPRSTPAPPTSVVTLHRCKVCGTRWLLWPHTFAGGGWNLLDKYSRPGSCCDNAAMGDQIEHLRDFDLSVPQPLTDDEAAKPSAADQDLAWCREILRWDMLHPPIEGEAHEDLPEAKINIPVNTVAFALLGAVRELRGYRSSAAAVPPGAADAREPQIDAEKELKKRSYALFTALHGQTCDRVDYATIGRVAFSVSHFRSDLRVAVLRPPR